MAKRHVVWTKTADLQFGGILEYWVKRNKSNTYSKKLVKIVSERTEQISKKPFIYKSTDFKDVRVASLGNFCIYYKIKNNVAQLLRIRLSTSAAFLFKVSSI